MTNEKGRPMNAEELFSLGEVDWQESVRLNRKPVERAMKLAARRNKAAETKRHKGKVMKKKNVIIIVGVVLGVALFCEGLILAT